MLALTRRIVIFAPMARVVAIAALLGTTMLASPLTAARADNAATVPVLLAQTTPQQVAAEATETLAQTVDHRITKLCERRISAAEYCQLKAAPAA
jgi:hypothetical protein